MSTFSARLISLRKERELSQEALGKVIQKKRSTISGYESEGKEPDIETICLLAKFFGVSTDYLLGYSEKRLNVDTVFFSDSVRFQKHYEALSPELRPTLAKCFDAYYRLLNRDVQLSRPERLEVYQELFEELSRLRAEISRKIELSGGTISDPVVLSDLMALQSELKNSVAALLDKLMQADMEVAFGVKEKGAVVSAG